MYQSAEKCPCSVRAALFASSLLVVLAVPVCADAETILTVDGAVSTAGGALELDLDEIKAMPQVTFRTSTNWTDGVSTFTGVALKHLMEEAGAAGVEVHATALNSYSAVIPLDSISEASPIVAYAVDGDILSRRDKGPLWIVYPFDESDAFRNDVIYGRSVWQLRSLSVK